MGNTPLGKHVYCFLIPQRNVHWNSTKEKKEKRAWLLWKWKIKWSKILKNPCERDIHHSCLIQHHTALTLHFSCTSELFNQLQHRFIKMQNSTALVCLTVTSLQTLGSIHLLQRPRCHVIVQYWLGAGMKPSGDLTFVSFLLLFMICAIPHSHPHSHPRLPPYNFTY